MVIWRYALIKWGISFERARERARERERERPKLVTTIKTVSIASNCFSGNFVTIEVE